MPKLIRKSPSVLLVALALAPAVASAQRPTRVAVPLEQLPGQPVARTLKVYEPPPGPPPQGIAIDAVGHLRGHRQAGLAAGPQRGQSYVVNRQLYQDPACCNATSGPITATSWTDTGLLKKGNYMYTVLVNYADGSVGKAGFGVRLDGVRNPVLTAQHLSAGQVRLTFDNNIPGTSGFLIGGPGMGNNGKMVSSGPVDTPILKPGVYTWTIASIYSGGLGILSHYTEWSTATDTVSYGAGHYRLSLEGFKAINVTAEDPFRNDGRGDEVYITTQVNEYGRNGGLVSSRMARTPTFGDVQNFPGRVKAGSASSTGGILPNDRYPAPVDLVADLQPPTMNNLPFLLWEGDLTELDGEVILSPAIWESDTDERAVPFFTTFQIGAAPDVTYRNAFSNYMPNSYGRGMLSTWNPQRNCQQSGTGGGPPAIFGSPVGWGDQPVDINSDNSYCPIYVPINYAVARSLTTTNRAAVVEIPMQNPSNNWKYLLYVRVEKMN